MHTFQPYPMNMLEFNPFQKIGSEWAAVTAEADGKANAMTVRCHVGKKRSHHLYP